MTRVFSAVRWILPLFCLLFVLGALGGRPALAAGTVGNGTAASCTESAFDSALSGGGNITFNCGATAKTILLSAIKSISANTNINGGNKITLKATNGYHFQVSNGKTLSLKDITLSKGSANNVGSIENFGTLKTDNVTFLKNQTTGDGGAIHNYGTTTIKNSHFIKNVAGGDGGAIYNEGGSVSVKGSTFTANKAIVSNFGGGAINNHIGSLTVETSTFTKNKSYNGGAIQNETGVTISSSTFDGNVATNGGGAIMNLNGTLSMTTSTVKGGHADYGGGLVLYGGSNVVSRSTISANSSDNDGGGIYSSSDTTFNNVTLSGNLVIINGKGGGGLFQNNGTGTLNFVTIVNNSATYGGGIYKESIATGDLYVHDTVLSNNTGGNCAGTPTSLGYNLSSDSYCSIFTNTGDKQNKNAKLGALANNGGPTLTHLPQASSPLIGKGIALGGITTDQRGVSRPQGGKIDIGSVEVP